MQDSAFKSIVLSEQACQAAKPASEPDASYGGALVSDFTLFHKPAAALTDVTEGEADYQRGLEEGRRATQDMYEKTIAVMQQSLKDIQDGFTHALQDIESSHMRAVETCLSASFPALVEAGTVQALVALITELAKTSLTGDVTVLTASRNQAHIEQLCTQSDLHIVLKEDDSIETGIRLLWSGGGASIDFESSAQACLDLIASSQGAPNISQKT